MDRGTGLILLSGAALAALVFSDQLKFTSAANAAADASPAVKLTPAQFTAAYLPFARSSEISTGVPALVTMAQAALESGWGAHAPGYNFFGIKAGSSWSGKVQKLKTWECGKTGNAKTDNIKDEVIAVYPPTSTNGNSACRSGGMYSYRTYSKFRAYDNAGQSFYDHGRFLRDNSRYAAAFRTKTPEEFLRVIVTSGYASSTPSYTETGIKVMNMIRKYAGSTAGRIAGFDLRICGPIEKAVRDLS